MVKTTVIHLLIHKSLCMLLITFLECISGSGVNKLKGQMFLRFFKPRASETSLFIETSL